MNKFAALLKLEFLSSSSRRDERRFSRVCKYLFAFLGGAALIGLILYAISMVMDVFITASIGEEFVVYFVAILSIAQLVIGINMTIKTLYNKTSVNILKLPVDGKLILLSKMAYLFIKEFVFTTIVALPVFIFYGIRTGAGAYFYSMLLPNLIFLPIVPFFLSIILSVPTVYIMRALKNKFIIMLILYAVVMSLAFIGYIYALKFLLNLLDNSNIADVFSDSTIFGMKQFANYLYLSVLFKNSLFGTKILQSIVINLAIVVFLGFMIYLFAEKLYLQIILNLSENQQKGERKSKIKERSVTKSLMKREFASIFRSSNYAFQYLTTVVTTPLMVYFSSEIASYVGVNLAGKDILPGIAVLVLIMFLSIGTSFSASTVTREGDNFYHTKIIPVSYTRQVASKFAIYLIVSIPSVFLSCFILAIANFISYVGALLTAISISLIVVGNICASISLDIRKPQFKYLDGGEVTTSNSNINASITLGFVVALIMGVGCIVVSYFVNIPSMYLVLFGFGVPFAAIECGVLFAKLEKRYSAIEV